MCGRFTLTVSARVMAEVFALDDYPPLAPRYNIAPTQAVVIVRATNGGSRRLGEARWGLVPSWAREPSIGARMINARSETAASKPAFRAAVRRRRCLIPADGFYEWRREGGGKQPYLVRFEDRRPFAFAGLWEVWRPQEGEPLTSCTILTTSPNELVAELHDRMPVILPPAALDEWLTPAELPETSLRRLLVPHPAAGMEALAVTRRVNSPANDDPACVEPLDGARGAST